MMYDCHVHLKTTTGDDYSNFPDLLKKAGFVGAALLGDRPDTPEGGISPLSFECRLSRLLDAASLGKDVEIFPFFRMDPLADDALEQVDKCVKSGIVGFKVMCSNFYPSDPRAMKVWEHITKHGKPVLFHSGILYNPVVSGKYNKPLEFEPLLFVPGFRFAMAHIAWPWCDELIAMLGKWTSLMKGNLEKYADFFIDTSPGTPELYREDALRKLLTIYEHSDNVMFGTDNMAANYSVDYAKFCLGMDERALAKIPEFCEKIKESMYGKAFLRFVGRR